jgi:hypothetical protein
MPAVRSPESPYFETTGARMTMNAAVGPDDRARDDGGVEAVLRGHAHGNGQRHRQRQRDDSHDHTRERILSQARERISSGEGSPQRHGEG